MFATDRDLLALEPSLFRDVAFAGQQLLTATGSLSGSTLTLASGDAAAVNITTGHVALIGAIPVEVLQRTSPTTLTISRLRPRTDAPAIPLPTMTSQPVTVHTFAPQIELVHRQVLHLIGIDPDDPQAQLTPGSPAESAILRPASLVTLESLGALHLIYAAASALLGPDSPAAARSDAYRRRFDAERQRTVVRLDLDGDGIADSLRPLGLIQLARA